MQTPDDLYASELAAKYAESEKIILTDVDQDKTNAKKPQKTQSKLILDGAKVTKINEDSVYLSSERMPEYLGGINALMEYISKNLVYPADAQKEKIEGRVIASFGVMKDGSIDNIQVVKSVYPSLDNETIRIIKNMPMWKPGMNGSEPVNVKFTIPISFKLPQINME